MRKNEIWKTIMGCEGKYQISNLGRVKSLCRKKGAILKTRINEFGYEIVGISRHGKRKNIRVHRLVAEAFIFNPNGFPCVNHKDENKSNNNVENLEWCTYQYNNTYGNRIKKQLAVTGKPVVQKSIGGRFIAVYPSMAQAQKNTGVDFRNISKCCVGRHKTAGGYVWEYAIESHGGAK